MAPVNYVDAAIIFRILMKLVTPFDKTKAFDLGLVDEKGKSLKKAKTGEEKSAMTLLDRMVFNLKRLLGTVPGGKTRLASYVAALALLKEHVETTYNKPTAQALFESMEEKKIIPKLRHDIGTQEGYLSAMEDAIMAEMNSGASLGGSLGFGSTNAQANASGLAAPTGPPVKRKKTGSVSKILRRI
mgnify:FL=1|tara:strand:- start:1137 stop:1694 length:558 start_codon:yes stop_codon:yes gene_type:complete